MDTTLLIINELIDYNQMAYYARFEWPGNTLKPITLKPSTVKQNLAISMQVRFKLLEPKSF